MGERRRWFSGGVGDGQAHYGELTAGRVQAVCGLAFTPMCSPITGRIVATGRPLDDTHGCRDCTPCGTATRDLPRPRSFPRPVVGSGEPASPALPRHHPVGGHHGTAPSGYSWESWPRCAQCKAWRGR